MERGKLVVDGLDPEPDEAIVILTPNSTIDEWETNDGTVADDNPDFDQNEAVVVVAFTHMLDDKWDGWEKANKEELFDGITSRSIPFYAFPESRLKLKENDVEAN